MDYAAPSLIEAPGAKGSRICGILAIVASLTCIGIPVGIILAIVALVQQAKAKRLARENPESYRVPTSSGLVLGIIGLVMPVLMLPFVGIVSAVAIPALLGQRTRAREKAVVMTLNTMLPDLANRYGRALETGAEPGVIKADLEQTLLTSPNLKNPYNPGGPAFTHTIAVITATTEDEVAAAAQAQATTLGEVTFIMSVPLDPQGPRFVAGAVQTQATGEHRIRFRVLQVN